MNNVYDTFKPKGFSTVNAYIFSENPVELIDFLIHAFYGELINQSLDPKTGKVSNVIIKIGESCFMISQARGAFLDMHSAFYLFADEVDDLHQRALQHGAKEVFKATDMDYQDRQSGVIDPSGNYWWISKRLVKKGYHE